MRRHKLSRCEEDEGGEGDPRLGPDGADLARVKGIYNVYSLLVLRTADFLGRRIIFWASFAFPLK